MDAESQVQRKHRYGESTDSRVHYKLHSDFQLGTMLELQVAQGPAVFLTETRLLRHVFCAVTQGSGLLPSSDSASHPGHPGHRGEVAGKRLGVTPHFPSVL